MSIEDLRGIGIFAFIAFAAAFLVGMILLVIILVKLRKLDVPPHATFVETLYYTPLIVVIAIDLLDLTLDFLAAPISWAILDRLGLKALRGVATVEALIPGTQLIPFMTLSWFGVRLLGIRS